MTDGVRQQRSDINPERAEPLWARWPDEPERAYVAFATFLSMPSAERDIEAARAQLQGVFQTKQSWMKWCAVWRWYERVAAFDRYRYQEEIRARDSQTSDEAVRWARERQELREEELGIGKALIAKAKAMLAFPLAEVERIEQEYENGQPRTIQIVKPGKWNFTNISQMIELGSKLIRLAAEMDTSHSRIDLRLIEEEAADLAKRYGVDAQDLMRIAEQIAEEKWGAPLTDES